MSVFAGINKHFTLYVIIADTERAMTLEITSEQINRIHNRFPIATATVENIKFYKILVRQDMYESLSCIVSFHNMYIYGEHGDTQDEAIDNLIKNLYRLTSTSN